MARSGAPLISSPRLQAVSVERIRGILKGLQLGV